MKKIMTYRQNMGKVKRYEILCGEQYQNVKKSELYQNNFRKCFHRFAHQISTKQSPFIHLDFDHKQIKTV